MPLRDAQQFFGTGNEYSYIMVQADTLEHVDAVAKAIKNKMGKGYNTITYESAMNLMNQVVGSIQAVLGGIAAISLIVAGIGIINTMTISVMERTREIGVLKAIGAKSMHVLMMFLSEAVFTGLIGGAIGVLLGFSLGGLIGSIVGIAPDPSLATGVMVIGFAVVTSTMSGIYPAWRAAHLNPVEALRSE
jgi:putative ABC transport system permease protein